VDAAFAAAVERLIEADPAVRYVTATQFLDDLTAITPPGTAQLILGRVVSALQDHRSGEGASLRDALANTELRETQRQRGHARARCVRFHLARGRRGRSARGRAPTRTPLAHRAGP
jgi:hypothetical protein